MIARLKGAVGMMTHPLLVAALAMGGLVQMQLMMVRATGMQGACTVLAPLPLSQRFALLDNRPPVAAAAQSS
jgi:hypothetical protein